MPDRSLGWPHLHLSALCQGPLLLSLLSQSALSDLSAGASPGLAHPATRPALTGAVLPGDLHAAGSAAIPRAAAAAPHLRPALPQLSDGLAAGGCRSALPRWADRDGGGAAHLDARFALPSAH